MNIPNEILDELISRELNLNRFDADLRKRIVKLLIELEKDIIGKLQGKNISDWSKKRLDDQLKSIKDTIGAYYSDISKITKSDYKELAIAEGENLQTKINKIVNVDLFSSMPSANQFAAMVDETMIQGAPNASWWARQGGDMYFRFASAVRMGYAQGESISNIVERVRGQFDIGKRNAEALVRTAVHTISSNAREMMYEENSDVIKGKVYTAVLDNRTSIQCITYDGAVYSLQGNPIMGTKLPYRELPAHWNCRSMYIPVLKSFKELGINLPEMPSSTRSSMDGQVPDSTKFKDFLEGKSKDFQNEVLGKGRAQLWRDGKITLQQLLDQSGNPIPLKDL